MQQPLVSVVIPVYNVELYLDRCMESVVSQTYENLEIILVDDGSPDRSPAMCDAWAEKDARIKVVHKQNAGLGMARNTGIDHASGKYIFFLDSDDYWDPATVLSCVSVAEKEDADVVLFGCSDAYDDGTVVKNPVLSEQRSFDRAQISEELLPGLFTYDLGFGISSCMKMFRLESIHARGLRFRSEKELISEDAFFVLEFFADISRAVALNRNFYYYYKRKNSLTTTYKAGRQQGNDVFLERSLAYVKQNGLSDSTAFHITARYHMYTIAAMKQLYRSDLPKKQKKQLLHDMMKNPNLVRTLSGDVLALHNKNLKLFFTLLKCHLYPLCRICLHYKK